MRNQTSQRDTSMTILHTTEDQPTYSVTQINTVIKSQLEGHFPRMWVQGEVSNFKRHSSGHCYFSLKDSESQIRAVMFKSYNLKLEFSPEDGMEVLVRASVTTFIKRGEYQLLCYQMQPVGQGALQAQFEQVKQKLQSEGLFDPGRKKPLPKYPQRIALVTSPTGAVIKDLLNVLTRRFQGLEITLIPTLVQGEAAVPEIIRAIDLAHQVRPAFDVMVVARGGGSMEDLWCFNSEDVARCIAFSSIPIVSAIGHEVDFTLSDFVADQRAPTPSVAAEILVPDKTEIKETIHHLTCRFTNAMHSHIAKHQQKYLQLSKRLKDPQKVLQELFQRNDELLQRLQKAFQYTLRLLRERYNNNRQKLTRIDQTWQIEAQKLNSLSENLRKGMDYFLANKKLALQNQAELLDSLSPLKVMTRGYSIVKLLKEPKIITSVQNIKLGDVVQITFAQGKAEAEIKQKHH